MHNQSHIKRKLLLCPEWPKIHPWNFLIFISGTPSLKLSIWTSAHALAKVSKYHLQLTEQVSHGENIFHIISNSWHDTNSNLNCRQHLTNKVINLVNWIILQSFSEACFTYYWHDQNGHVIYCLLLSSSSKSLIDQCFYFIPCLEV